MSLRERNKQDKHDRIRAAAAALFSELGYEATTTRAVAARAGVATGTVFLYAGTKEDLLFLVWRDQVDRALAQAWRSLPKGGLVDQLVHVFGALIDFYAADLPLARVYMKEALFSTGEAGAENRQFTYVFLGRVGGLVETAQAQGELSPDVVVPMAASGFFSTYLFLLIGFLMGELQHEAMRPLLEAAFQQQIQGLQSGGSS